MALPAIRATEHSHVPVFSLTSLQRHLKVHDKRPSMIDGYATIVGRFLRYTAVPDEAVSTQHAYARLLERDNTSDGTLVPSRCFAPRQPKQGEDRQTIEVDPKIKLPRRQKAYEMRSILEFPASTVMPVKALHRMPLRTQVANQIREELLTKHQPGDRLPTEVQLVKQYGVSLITVKEALSILAHEHLIERHQGRGTFVCDPGQRPATGSTTQTILARTALVSDLTPESFNSSTYFLPLLTRIGSKLQEIGLGTRLYIGLGRPTGQATTDTFFADLGDGLINGVIGAGLSPYPPLLSALKTAKIPLLSNDAGFEDHISTDISALHRNGLLQLSASGRRRIGMLNPHGEVIDPASLPAGATVTQITPASWSITDSADAVSHLLKQDPRLDALLLADDFYLPGALVALARHGLHTPADVLICVHHNQGSPEPQMPCILAEVDIDALAKAFAQRMQNILKHGAIEAAPQILAGRVRAIGNLTIA